VRYKEKLKIYGPEAKKRGEMGEILIGAKIRRKVLVSWKKTKVQNHREGQREKKKIDWSMKTWSRPILSGALASAARCGRERVKEEDGLPFEHAGSLSRKGEEDQRLSQILTLGGKDSVSEESGSMRTHYKMRPTVGKIGG